MFENEYFHFRIITKSTLSEQFKTMRKLIFIFIFFSFWISAFSQNKNQFAVVAYYAGKNPAQADSFEVEKLTHIIFSFCHLKGNRINVNNANDTAIIQKLVALKKRNPNLKVMLSLGGWGGCETCSDVFSVRKNRKVFAESVKELSEYFATDGIDLDWEYPTIPGFPNHKNQAQDKEDFTKLIKQLRKTLGKNYVISFAAGGFSQYIDEAVDWKKLCKNVDLINLMTYDLVGGYSTVTGHHTALYSTPEQTESIDHAVQKLEAYHVPQNKIIIGAAFYGRIWDSVPDINSGLYQKGRFFRMIPYKSFASELSIDSGFVYHWDEKAHAPYLYNPQKHLFVTYDDTLSMKLKTQYAVDKKLGGIMFWQLTSDSYTKGLLDVIDTTKRNSIKKQPTEQGKE